MTLFYLFLAGSWLLLAFIVYKVLTTGGSDDRH
jgi:hypothetical protein